jgi:hypothetical protein
LNNAETGQTPEVRSITDSFVSGTTTASDAKSALASAGFSDNFGQSLLDDAVTKSFRECSFDATRASDLYDEIAQAFAPVQLPNVELANAVLLLKSSGYRGGAAAIEAFREMAVYCRRNGLVSLVTLLNDMIIL